MSYTITRASDDDADVLCGAVQALVGRQGYNGYYVELEGEPGELIAAGILLDYDPATRTSRIAPVDADGNRLPSLDEVMCVDVDAATELRIP